MEFDVNINRSSLSVLFIILIVTIGQFYNQFMAVTYSGSNLCYSRQCMDTCMLCESLRR